VARLETAAIYEADLGCCCATPQARRVLVAPVLAVSVEGAVIDAGRALTSRDLEDINAPRRNHSPRGDRMTMTLRKAAVGLAAAGAMMAGGALAFAQGNGPGPALCFPVPGINHAQPRGGPGYAFFQPAPASGRAIDKVCGVQTTTDVTPPPPAPPQ
jgi:hypothetical protein